MNATGLLYPFCEAFGVAAWPAAIAWSRAGLSWDGLNDMVTGIEKKRGYHEWQWINEVVCDRACRLMGESSRC